MADNKMSLRGVCLGCKEIKSKKTGNSYYILQFFVDKDQGELLELLYDKPIGGVTSFSELADGNVKVGEVTFEQSVYQRRLTLRFVSFVV